MSAHKSSARTQPHTIHLQSVNHSLGYITGLTHIHPETQKPIAHSFHGLPYALPPLGPFRFRRPRPLPACYRYGTLSNPGVFTGGCGVCPQVPLRGPPKEAEWDEDCLQVNLWVPAGDAPNQGWPVLFWIHGGWLQIGTPNAMDCRELLSRGEGQGGFRGIIVAPAYRLNVFGFLASGDGDGGKDTAVPNCGFWDQRLALEWTWKWCSYFGGNPGCITLGGYSAGAHSTFHQLAYDLRQAPAKRIIKRAIMFSNGPGLQPKSATSITTKQQYRQLLRALDISTDLTITEQLTLLRSLSASALVRAAASIDLHEFRGTTDNSFISSNLFASIEDGTFAANLREAGIELVIGECKDEHHVYGAYRPPKADSFTALRHRLCADFAPEVVDALLDTVYSPKSRSSDPSTRSLPVIQGQRSKTWLEAYGRIVAQLQVHSTERGFINQLYRHGAGHLIHRYRIEYRLGCVDASTPKEWGVTHGTDLAIWFWGNGAEVSEKEGKTLRRWLAPVWRWVVGRGFGRVAEGRRQIRRLRGDGTDDFVMDGEEDWEHGLGVWDVARRAQRMDGLRNGQAKL